MDKSLKKLSRIELLEVMVSLSEAYEEQFNENKFLRKELSAQRRSMREAQRLPRAAKAGSIAEAALQANGYFEAAQRSADDYLREIKRLHDEFAQRNEAQAAQLAADEAARKAAEESAKSDAAVTGEQQPAPLAGNPAAGDAPASSSAIQAATQADLATLQAVKRQMREAQLQAQRADELAREAQRARAQAQHQVHQAQRQAQIAYDQAQKAQQDALLAQRERAQAQAQARQIEQEARDCLRDAQEYPVLFIGTPCQVAGLRSFLGELAQSEVWLRILRRKLTALGDLRGKSLTLHVPRGATSRVIGQKRKNKLQIEHEFTVKSVSVIENDIFSEYTVSIEVHDLPERE